MYRIATWTNQFRDDLRFGVRQLRRAPGYALFTVLVLALGIGTVTAMFAVSYGVLLSPLPFHADRQLFQAAADTTTADENLQASYAEITQWQDATRGSADVAFASLGLNILDAPAGAEIISEVFTGPSLFSVLGVKPILGRGFSPDGEISDHPETAILSYETWQGSFAGDPNVLGKTTHIGGVLYTIVGVMPKHFQFPVYEARSEVWVPVERGMLPESASNPYGSPFEPILRLHSGERPEKVQAELTSVHARFTKHDQPSRIHLVRLRNSLVQNVQPALVALLAAAIIVWLIACSNVAGLLLARVAARRTEIAARLALGSGRGRIIAQFLTESLLLSAAGALGGLALAVSILRVFRHAIAGMLPLGGNIQMNWIVWAALVVLTLATALAFGTMPALMAARMSTRAGLRGNSRTWAGDRGQNMTRSLLLVSEVALSIALLMGAGLMVRTMYALRHVPLGFRTDHLLLTNLTAPSELYKDKNVDSVAWQPLLDAVRRVPGVKGAALSTVMPLKHPVEWQTIIYKTDWTHGDVSAVVRAASPGLMDVLGIRMRAGRFFTDSDTATSLPVTVVNRAFVNQYLGGGNPLAKQIRFGRVPSAATIVGVIDDVRQDAVTDASRPEFYVCIPQVARDNPLYRMILSRYMELAVRTEVQPQPMVSALRHSIAEGNPHLAIGSFTTMREAVEDSIGAQKVAARVVGVFAALALLITVAGLYGLLSYLVQQRTPEIGIRMALGADRAAIVGMVLRQTLTLMSAGAIIGIGFALWSNRLLHAFLYGVSPSDPWSIGLAPMCLVLCGLIAAAVPARRAASVNPIEALRAE